MLVSEQWAAVWSQILPYWCFSVSDAGRCVSCSYDEGRFFPFADCDGCKSDCGPAATRRRGMSWWRSAGLVRFMKRRDACGKPYQTRENATHPQIHPRTQCSDATNAFAELFSRDAGSVRIVVASKRINTFPRKRAYQALVCAHPSGTAHPTFLVGVTQS